MLGYPATRAKDSRALSQEIWHAENEFRSRFGIDPFLNLSPGTLMRHLASEIVRVRHAIRDLEKDLLAFEDIKKLKAWLKEMRRQAETDDFDDCPF